MQQAINKQSNSAFGNEQDDGDFAYEIDDNSDSEDEEDFDLEFTGNESGSESGNKSESDNEDYDNPSNCVIS